eukprot:7061402-Prorocentrum_lima.AAC.1
MLHLATLTPLGHSLHDRVRDTSYGLDARMAPPLPPCLWPPPTALGASQATPSLQTCHMLSVPR